MRSLFTSILIGLSIFLGNISGQAKSFKIVEHVSSEHSVHTKSHSHTHHHHDHPKAGKKNSGPHDHQHTVELSFVTISLALPSYEGLISDSQTGNQTTNGYYSIEILNQLSFSPPVFRPPIA